MKSVSFRCIVWGCLFLSGLASAQDTLSPGIANYAEIFDDWIDQDDVASRGYKSAINAIIKLSGLPSSEKSLIESRLNSLSGKADDSPEMQTLYRRACSARRVLRMGTYLERFRKVIFSQHPVAGGGYFNANYWNHSGYEGKGLELLTMNGYYGSVIHLVDGEARNPCVSFDAAKVLYAWKGGGSGSSSYHIYEMTLADRKWRRITDNGASGACWDSEPIYLPNGNIIFSSTRHIQGIDCISGEAANLFLCDKDGKYIRRICYDQVPTHYPVVMPSGEVVYCRWDYNDKSHTYGHALFIMNPDGTKQREYCNNNSWWPTMILQQRPIPGTSKIMAMIGGYHTPQHGKIGIIDVSVGMQNGQGVTLLAPVRLPKDDNLDTWGAIPSGTTYPYDLDWSMFPRAGARPMDRWGQDPPLSCYPYPFDENAFLVSHRPKAKETAWSGRFALYFMNADGSRELLFYDESGSAMAAVPVAARAKPPVLASEVNYHKTTGVFQIMNIYTTQPPLLDGVEKGVIKRLRVAGLYYRPGPAIGHAAHFGPGCINYGGSGYNNAIATTNASWDAKIIIGETPVYEDGSAAFIAPARMPLYFQALDEKGHVVQTMRSWTMVQPGETFACMGCHESKMVAPPPLTYVPIALKEGAKPLEPFYGPARGFSYQKEVQPVFDAKCATCHNADKPGGLDLRGGRFTSSQPEFIDQNFKQWEQSYCDLTSHDNKQSYSKYVHWFHAEDSPLLQPPYRAGSSKSLLVSTLEKGHKNLRLTNEELDKIRCWIDLGVPHFADYTEGLAATEKTKIDAQITKQKKWETEERANIAAYLQAFPTAAVAGSVSELPGQYILQATRVNLALRADVRNGTLRLRIGMPASASREKITVGLYSIKGALIRCLMDEIVGAGNHTFVVSGAMLPAGNYIVRMAHRGSVQVAPVVIVH